MSDESRQIAANLHIPVRIIAFYNAQEHDQRRQMEDLLQLFADASPQISFRLLDLDREPALAKKYGVGSFNTGVLLADGKQRELKGIDEEENINAVLRLTRRNQRVLCFLSGHGEHSPQDPSDRQGYSEVAKALGRPGATHAVGSACGANPIPVLVPCHRVLAANSKLGGFSGGLDWKRLLLAREGVRVV